MTALEQPHILDADEWRHQAQNLAVAAVRLAERVAADYGVELEMVSSPSPELRVKGKPFRVGGGIDDPRREPTELLSVRQLAGNALAYERLLGRRIDKTLAGLSAAERTELEQAGRRVAALEWPAGLSAAAAS